MARVKGLSAADQKLWAAFSQTISILPGRTKLPIRLEPAAVTPMPSVPAIVVPPKTASKPVHPDMPPAGLDKSTWKKFASGKLRAGQWLDLHGMTAARAHHATAAFIQNAYTDQIRCIEIITGKGEVLARELPHWLNAPSLRPLILAIAHPHRANTGSIRLLVRRLR